MWGKWKRDDHIARGIEMTEELSERMGLDQEERSMLRFLVEHHQDMVLISRRRNLDDYEMIAEFAGLFANEEWLRALYLVSYADLSAVAPDAWDRMARGLAVGIVPQDGRAIAVGHAGPRGQTARSPDTQQAPRSHRGALVSPARRPVPRAH